MTAAEFTSSCQTSKTSQKVSSDVTASNQRHAAYLVVAIGKAMNAFSDTPKWSCCRTSCTP